MNLHLQQTPCRPVSTRPNVAPLFAAFVLSTMLAAPEGAAREATGVTPAVLDQRMQRFLTQTKIPGIAVVVLQEGAADYTKGFGLRSVAATLPVDEHTVFKMNSVTKSMTATAMAAFVDQGKLRWDDRLIDFLPQFRLSDPWITREVTFEDAMSHRVGVEATDWLEDVPNVTLDEAIHRMRDLPQANRFRATFLYDNFMYSVAGVAAARLAGDWDRMMRENLFRPLGMTDSFTEVESYLRPDAIAPCHECELEAPPPGLDALTQPLNIAAPHFYAQGRAQLSNWRTSSSRPAGAVWSSAHDMAKYLKLYLHAGKVAGRAVLSAEAMEQLTTPRIPARTAGVDGRPPRDERALREAAHTGDYALGWEVGSYLGHRFIMHDGNSIEFQSQVVIFPDDGLAVALMANVHDGRHDAAFALSWEIVDALLGLSPIPWVEAMVKESDEEARAPPRAVCARDARSAPASRPRALARYEGRYHHPVYGDLTVTPRDEQTLLVSQGPGRWGALRPVDEGCFELRWNGVRPGPQEVTFIRGRDGGMEALRLRGQTFSALEPPRDTR